MKKIVIIGASIAGHTVAVGLREKIKDCQISLITEGSYPLYDKSKLLQYLCGLLKEKDLLMVGPDFYQQQSIEFLKDRKVVQVSPSRKVVHCRHKDKRESYEYDFLAVCSGRRSVLPEIAGINKEGIYTLDSLNDYKQLRQHLISDPVCFIGSVRRALPAATMLAGKQREVKVISAEGMQPAEPIDGMEIVSSEVIELIGESGVQAIRLKEGKIIGTSLPVFVPALTAANSDFLKESGIAMEGELLCVDESMRTSIKTIYASGAVCTRQGAAAAEKSRDEAIQESRMLVDALEKAIGGADV